MLTFEIEADLKRQVIRTYFRGVVQPASLAAAAETSAALIAQMQPGFTVITDLTELERMEIDCTPYIARLMDHFQRAGVGRVLRVIPDASKDIGFTLLSHTHYRGKVPFQTLVSASDAETALPS